MFFVWIAAGFNDFQSRSTSFKPRRLIERLGRAHPTLAPGALALHKLQAQKINRKAWAGTSHSGPRRSGSVTMRWSTSMLCNCTGHEAHHRARLLESTAFSSSTTDRIVGSPSRQAHGQACAIQQHHDGAHDLDFDYTAETSARTSLCAAFVRGLLAKVVWSLSVLPKVRREFTLCSPSFKLRRSYVCIYVVEGPAVLLVLVSTPSYFSSGLTS